MRALPAVADAAESPLGAEPGQEGFRRAMRHQAAGVAVVTTAHLGPVGFCASSVASVCLDPPTLSFAVSTVGTSGAAWSASAGGLVHLLHEGQQSVAQRFSLPGAVRFDGRHPWSWSPEGYPELTDRLALLAIRVTTRLVVGDHLVVVGAVDRVQVREGLRPLAYHAGRFCRVEAIPTPTDRSAASKEVNGRKPYHRHPDLSLTSVPSGAAPPTSRTTDPARDLSAHPTTDLKRQP